MSIATQKQTLRLKRRTHLVNHKCDPVRLRKSNQKGEEPYGDLRITYDLTKFLIGGMEELRKTDINGDLTTLRRLRLLARSRTKPNHPQKQSHLFPPAHAGQRTLMVPGSRPFGLRLFEN